MQVGLRERLLCQGCEHHFNREWEQPALKIIRRAEVKARNAPRYIVLSDVDCARLRLFSLSMLWRAGITSLHAFQNAKIDRHTDRLRTILREEQSDFGEYPVAIMSVKGETGKRTTIPFREGKRIGGARVLIIQARGFAWQYFVPPAGRLSLHRPMLGSDEGRLMIPVVRWEDREVLQYLAQLDRAWNG
jgi:hypothetical protein